MERRPASQQRKMLLTQQALRAQGRSHIWKSRVLPQLQKSWNWRLPQLLSRSASSAELALGLRYNYQCMSSQDPLSAEPPPASFAFQFCMGQVPGHSVMTTPLLCITGQERGRKQAKHCATAASC